MTTFLLFALLALEAGPVYPNEIVPFDVQVPLVLKALTYDRNLKMRASDEVRIALVLPPKGAQSLADDLQAAIRKLPGRTINGLAVVFTVVSATDEASLEEGLRRGQWAAAYILPGFSRAELTRVRRLCESRRVLPVAASIDDLQHGLAFGIGIQGSKPQIVVNLPASKACGSDFDLALLQLSRVLQ